MFILTSQCGPSTLSCKSPSPKMCPVLVSPCMMKQSNEHQRSDLMEHGIFKLFMCFVMASFKNGPWCLPRRIHRPPTPSPGFKFQLTILKQNLGNFVGDIDGISALSHYVLAHINKQASILTPICQHPRSPCPRLPKPCCHLHRCLLRC